MNMNRYCLGYSLDDTAVPPPECLLMTTCMLIVGPLASRKQGVQKTDGEGRQALHWAASRGHVASIRWASFCMEVRQTQNKQLMN
eukprot:1283694-Amphidinium_carterae.1